MGQNKGIQLRTADHDWHKTAFSAKLNACSDIWTETPSSTTNTPKPIQQKCAVCFFLHAPESGSLLFFLFKQKKKHATGFAVKEKGKNGVK